MAAVVVTMAVGAPFSPAEDETALRAAPAGSATEEARDTLPAEAACKAAALARPAPLSCSWLDEDATDVAPENWHEMETGDTSAEESTSAATAAARCCWSWWC